MQPKIFAILGLLAVVLASGCVQTQGTGNLVLKITDQPNLDIEKALVTISKVQVHAAGESNTTEAGWITVVEEPNTFDLIEIMNVEAFLGSSELAVGRYTQIRLTVDSALVTINNTEHNLTIPSGTVKLVRSFEIEENETTTLILDFDAQQSIHSAGASDKYIMRPTVTVTQE